MKKNYFYMLAFGFLVSACGGGNSDSNTTTETPVQTPDVGPPAITGSVEGDGQIAEVNTLVSVLPSMFVADANGVRIPNVAVTFTVTMGNGSATSISALTNENGIASVGSWMLGPVPGENELTGEVDGLAPVFFRATALADSSGSLLRYDGDIQYANVQNEVATAPSVILRDGNGDAVVGAEVTFEVRSGDGQISGQLSITNSGGIAQVGAWSLGDTPGGNTLAASVPGLPEVIFSATAVSNEDPVLIVDQTYLTGLDRPWDIAFSPDGVMVFTEREGRLRALVPGTLEPITLANPDDINPSTQSGMLGVALDPDFIENRRIYVFLSSNRGGSMDNRIRRFTVDESWAVATEDRDIFTGIAWGANGGHSGGRIRFGPDGYLYITTGDNRAATIPQDLNNLGSKVLRITTGGAPAPGNHDWEGAGHPAIFAYGFRNPQGIAFRPGSEQVWLCEHGPNQDDEVTRLVSGGNGGWDPDDGEGNYNGYTGALMTDLRLSNVLGPTYIVSDSQGMCGCDFLDGTQWKSWDGRLAIAMLSGRRMIVVNMDADGTNLLGPALNEFQGLQRLRVIVQGPDGSAYIAIDEPGTRGAIWRVTPS